MKLAKQFSNSICMSHCHSKSNDILPLLPVPFGTHLEHTAKSVKITKKILENK